MESGIPSTSFPTEGAGNFFTRILDTHKEQRRKKKSSSYKHDPLFCCWKNFYVHFYVWQSLWQWIFQYFYALKEKLQHSIILKVAPLALKFLVWSIMHILFYVLTEMKNNFQVRNWYYKTNKSWTVDYRRELKTNHRLLWPKKAS